jgi:hypothetical protein
MLSADSPFKAYRWICVNASIGIFSEAAVHADKISFEGISSRHD